LPKAPYYIIFTRKNQVLLSFLDIRVVVNNKEIYPLQTTEPVVIPLEKDNPRVVITDGYHFTKPLELNFRRPAYFNFEVVCAIDDLQLLAGSLILAIFYMLGFLTGFFILKLLSFAPIVWVLIYYYFNRKNFIRIVKAGK
jgi:hypothetical protein